MHILTGHWSDGGMPSRKCCTAEGGITVAGGGTLDILPGETKSRMRRMVRSSSLSGSSLSDLPSSRLSSPTLEMKVVEKEPGNVDADH